MGIGHWALGVRRQASGIWHLASGITVTPSEAEGRHLASGIPHPGSRGAAPGTRHLHYLRNIKKNRHVPFEIVQGKFSDLKINAPV